MEGQSRGRSVVMWRIGWTGGLVGGWMDGRMDGVCPAFQVSTALLSFMVEFGSVQAPAAFIKMGYRNWVEPGGSVYLGGQVSCPNEGLGWNVWRRVERGEGDLMGFGNWQTVRTSQDRRWRGEL